MKVNINHPSFISFLDSVTSNILGNIDLQNYFTLTQEKKITTQYSVLTLMKNAVKVRAKLTESELISFVNILWRRNEESENYEFAAVLNDISKNFNKINEIVKPKKRTVRKIKTDTNNG